MIPDQHAIDVTHLGKPRASGDDPATRTEDLLKKM